jgi:AcrR family transcriptional regulator
MSATFVRENVAQAIKPDRRQQIVNAAAAVLGRQGYANTSLKQVAAEAGIAPGLLHYYFQTKEELLLEVVGQIDHQLMADWEADTAGITDPMAKINAGFDRAVENCTQRPEFYRLLLDAYALALDNPSILGRTQEMLENFCGLIRNEIASLPLVPPSAQDNDRFDFPGAIAGAMTGIAFLSLVRHKSPEYAYNAFKLQTLGLAAASYLASGQEVPAALVDAIRAAAV